MCGMHLVGGELLEVFVKAFQARVGLLHVIMHPGSLLSLLLPLTLQLQATDALYMYSNMQRNSNSASCD